MRLGVRVEGRPGLSTLWLTRHSPSPNLEQPLRSGAQKKCAATFDSHGCLRRGEEVLATVTEDAPGAVARVTVKGVEYRVAVGKRGGWNFVMRRADSVSSACEFLPHRLRRGGRLIGARSDVQLRRSWRVGQWHLVRADGFRIATRSKWVLERKRDEGRTLEIDLQAEQALDIDSDTLLATVFGCWLIAQWETTVLRPASGPPLLWDGL
jgi:hypothetical protein